MRTLKWLDRVRHGVRREIRSQSESGCQVTEKFVYKGMAPVTAKDQGVLWPKKK